MKKYTSIIIVIIFFATPSIILAAQPVPGSVPDIPPLQPVDPNVKPNYQHNVQANPAAMQTDAESYGNGSTTGISPDGVDAAVAATASSTPTSPSRTKWISLAILVVVLCIGAGVFLKGMKAAQ